MFKMFLSLRAILLIAICGNVIQSQVPESGKCPENVTVKTDFNPEKYLGRWYEYSKYPFIFELGAKCIIAVYGDLGVGKISVTNTQYGSVTGLKSDIKGTAKQVEPAKLLVEFPFAPINGLSASNYWVLDTDYENYAVVYACYDFFIINAKVVWILTRARKPAQEIISKAKEVITRNGLSLSPLITTDQNNCPA